MQAFQNFDRVLFALENLNRYLALVYRQLTLTDAQITILTNFAEGRLHGKTIPFSLLLGGVVSVNLIDDGLEAAWVQRSGLDNVVFCLFLKSVDRSSSLCPLWIVERPFLITEPGFDLVEAEVTWGIVKTDCSKFE